MERGFLGQAIRLWRRLTGASLLKRSNQYTCQVKCHGAAYLHCTHPFGSAHTHTYTHRNTHPCLLTPSLLANEVPLLSLFEKKKKKSCIYTPVPPQWRGEREQRGALEHKRGGTITVIVEVKILLDRIQCNIHLSTRLICKTLELL